MFLTTIKHAKQTLAVLLMALMICPNALAAGEYQLGLKAAEKQEWKSALELFKKVGSSNADYSNALRQIAVVGEKLEAQKQASKTSRRIKEKKEELDKKTQRCNNLFGQGSPDAHLCLETMRKSIEEISAILEGEFGHDGYENLKNELAPYAELDKYALELLKTGFGERELEKAAENIMRIETQVSNPKTPSSIVDLGHYVLAHRFQGHVEAHYVDCKDVQAANKKKMSSNGLSDDDEELESKICDRVNVALAKFGKYQSKVPHNFQDRIGEIPAQVTRVLPAHSKLLDVDVAQNKYAVANINTNVRPFEAETPVDCLEKDRAFFDRYSSAIIAVGSFVIGGAIIAAVYKLKANPVQAAGVAAVAAALVAPEITTINDLLDNWAANPNQATVQAIVAFAHNLHIQVAPHGNGQFVTLHALVTPLCTLGQVGIRIGELINARRIGQ